MSDFALFPDVERFKVSWRFTRTVLGHGRWKSFRQAVRNAYNKPKQTDNEERRAVSTP